MSDYLFDEPNRLADAICTIKGHDRSGITGVLNGSDFYVSCAYCKFEARSLQPLIREDRVRARMNALRSVREGFNQAPRDATLTIQAIIDVFDAAIEAMDKDRRVQ